MREPIAIWSERGSGFCRLSRRAEEAPAAAHREAAAFKGTHTIVGGRKSSRFFLCGRRSGVGDGGAPHAARSSIFFLCGMMDKGTGYLRPVS